MPCSEALLRAAPRGLLAAALLAVAGAASAHKSSDSYLQIAVAPAGLSVRWDIALRDLDSALDLDGDADGKLTWGEVKAAWPRIEAYATARLAIEGCALRVDGRGLERRSDGAYAVLKLLSDCRLAAQPKLAYSLFAEIDPTHRGIAKIERPGAELALLVLDPARSAAGALAAASALPSAAAATAPAPVAWQFLAEGVHHIVTGYDHVLFLLCLLLPSVMRRTPQGWRPVDRFSQAFWPIAGIVTAFTVAHSVTLCLAALELVSLPAALIEPAIAVTIILAALDNVLPVFPVRRWIVAFCFGLIHGFGFAGVLAELSLPAGAFAWALLQFNVGLELGQLAIVVAVTTVLFLARRRTGYSLWVIRSGSLVAIAIGLLWLVERTAGVKVLPF